MQTALSKAEAESRAASAALQAAEARVSRNAQSRTSVTRDSMAEAGPQGRGAKLKLFKIVVCVIGWYTVSISVTFANKWLLSDLHFDCPFAMMSYQNANVFLIAALVTRIPPLRPAPLPMSSLLGIIFPIGALTAVDLGLTNWSLALLPVSVHTIIRGTVPAFVLLAGLVLGLEQMSLLLGGSVLLVVVGTILAMLPSDAATGTSAAASQLNVLAVMLSLSSCAMGGVRWALTQVPARPPLTSFLSTAIGLITATIYRTALAPLPPPGVDARRRFEGEAGARPQQSRGVRLLPHPRNIVVQPRGLAAPGARPAT